MKWMGLAITSAVMGAFVGVIAEFAIPGLTREGFTAVAILGGITIFAIMLHMTITAGTIEVHPTAE